MKRDTINYFAVGLFVIAMIVALFALMYYVTGRTGPSDEYVVHYDNVAGLKFGTGVFYEGYRVGQIERITPEPDDNGMRYRLDISVEKDWRIPRDSEARVVASGLISAVQIHINEGESSENLEPGDEITGREQQNLFAVLSEAAGEFRTMSEHGVMPVLKNLNERIDEISTAIISFRQDQLAPLADTLNQRLNEDVMDAVQVLIARLDNSAKQLEKILGEDNEQQVSQFLVHIDAAAVNLNDLITRIELTRVQMGETLNSIGNLASSNEEAVSEAVANASDSMREMQAALAVINEHLDTIMYNIDGSTRNLNEFAKAVRANPARLIRGSESPDDERE